MNSDDKRNQEQNGRDRNQERDRRDHNQGEIGPLLGDVRSREATELVRGAGLPRFDHA